VSSVASLIFLSVNETIQEKVDLSLSALRTIKHLHAACSNQHNDQIERLYHLFHAGLSASCVGLSFYNPALARLSSSTSDLMINIHQLGEKYRNGNYIEAIESLAFLALDALFIASFCYGAIEITVTCMLLQVCCSLYSATSQLKEGDYLGGVCQALVTAIHGYRSIPQCKLFK